jgi:hypothetical protein
VSSTTDRSAEYVNEKDAKGYKEYKAKIKQQIGCLHENRHFVKINLGCDPKSKVLPIKRLANNVINT